jgi:hypothetical protein
LEVRYPLRIADPAAGYKVVKGILDFSARNAIVGVPAQGINPSAI